MMDDVERELLEAESPEPGWHVRARVLGAAIPLVQRDYSWLDRIWFSRTCRMGAVFTLLAVIGVDVVSGRFIALAPGALERQVPDVAHAVTMAAVDLRLTSADAAELAARAVASTLSSRVFEDPNSSY